MQSQSISIQEKMKIIAKNTTKKTIKALRKVQRGLSATIQEVQSSKKVSDDAPSVLSISSCSFSPPNFKSDSSDSDSDSDSESEEDQELDELNEHDEIDGIDDTPLSEVLLASSNFVTHFTSRQGQLTN